MSMTDDYIDEKLNEIKQLRKVVQDLDNRLNTGRHYLMSARPESLSIEDALEAFGYNRNGFEKEETA